MLFGRGSGYLGTYLLTFIYVFFILNYRLRFINIALGGERIFRLARGGFPVEWRPLAQDAGELPPHQRERTEARVELNVGETYDVTYTPEVPGSRCVWEIRWWSSRFR